jgi:hypothetical protein
MKMSYTIFQGTDSFWNILKIFYQIPKNFFPSAGIWICPKGKQWGSPLPPLITSPLFPLRKKCIPGRDSAGHCVTRPLECLRMGPFGGLHSDPDTLSSISRGASALSEKICSGMIKSRWNKPLINAQSIYELLSLKTKQMNFSSAI